MQNLTLHAEYIEPKLITPNLGFYFEDEVFCPVTAELILN